MRNNIVELGKKTRMKKGQTLNPNGRPKKIATLLKKQGLKASQINDIIKEMLNMSIGELEKIATNQESKSFEILLAVTIKKAITKGDLSQVFGYALNRAYGPIKETKEDEKAIIWNETKIYEKKEVISQDGRKALKQKKSGT